MMRQKHGCWLRALLITFPVTAASPTVYANEIRIWPTAVVAENTITLGDVADLRGFDAAAMMRLSALAVGDAPRYGGGVLVQADDVRAALAEAGTPLGRVRIFGSSRCKVSRLRATRKSQAKSPMTQKKRKPVRTPNRLGSKKRAVSPESLESILRNYIAARLSLDEGRLEIRFSSARELALKRPEYKFSIRAQNRKKLGLSGFEVDIRKAGEAKRTVSIAAEVFLVKDVVVARRPINQGAVIAGRDLKLEERRFDKLDAIGLTDLSAAVGLRSRHFFRQGDMLNAESLETRPLVRRGDSVKILVGGDGLEIRTTGKAQQTGGLGDMIAVRRDGSKRKQDLIEAVVTGPGLVTYYSAPQ